MSNPRGRPSKFSQKVAEEICERLADGESLRNICLSDDMPSKGTVCRWLSQDASFQDQYARAREMQADSFADDIPRIADEEEDPQKARVRIDARKWAAGKQRPKKYGDKLDLNHGGQDDNPVKIQSIKRVIIDDNAND